MRVSYASETGIKVQHIAMVLFTAVSGVSTALDGNYPAAVLSIALLIAIDCFESLVRNR